MAIRLCSALPRYLRILLLQRQDLCSTRHEAFAVGRAIAGDPDLSLLGRLVHLCPCISARPRTLAGRQRLPTRQSREGRLQLSLDEPIHRLDKRPQRFTPWWSCKCSRQNSSAQWTSLTPTPRSFQQTAQCNRHGLVRHQDDSPGNRQTRDQSSGTRAPPVVEPDGDEGCG